MIPRPATELIVFSHRLRIEWGSDEYKEFVAQRTDLRKKAKELWAQCDEEARKRVGHAANARAPIVRDERTNAVNLSSTPGSRSAVAPATATSVGSQPRSGKFTIDILFDLRRCPTAQFAC